MSRHTFVQGMVDEYYEDEEYYDDYHDEDDGYVAPKPLPKAKTAPKPPKTFKNSMLKTTPKKDNSAGITKVHLGNNPN